MKDVMTEKSKVNALKKQLGYTDGHSKAGFALNVGFFKINNAMIYFQGKTY